MLSISLRGDGIYKRLSHRDHRPRLSSIGCWRVSFHFSDRSGTTDSDPYRTRKRGPNLDDIRRHRSGRWLPCQQRRHSRGPITSPIALMRAESGEPARIGIPRRTTRLDRRRNRPCLSFGVNGATLGVGAPAPGTGRVAPGWICAVPAVCAMTGAVASKRTAVRIMNRCMLFSATSPRIWPPFCSIERLDSVLGAHR